MVVFDFDETIFKKNTFPIFVSWVLIYFLKRNELKKTIYVLSLIVRRKVFNSIQHRYFKQKMESIINDRMCTLFASFLCDKKCWNDTILLEIEKLYSENNKVIISSAALQSYLIKVIEIKGINCDYIIGSRFIDGAFFDNYKENKANTLSNCMQQLGDRFTCFYTDSFDDIESMKLAEHTILVLDKSNSSVDFRFLQDKNIDFDIMYY